MNREIKFRAWDIYAKDMRYVDDMYWFEENGVNWIEQDGSAAKIAKQLGFEQLAYQPDYYEKGIGTRLFCKRVNHNQ
jgi:hypothetical protein